MFQTILARLHTRFLLFILVSVAPAFGVVFYTNIEQRAQAHADAQQQALQNTQYLVVRLRDFVMHSQQLLASVANTPEVRGLTPVSACNKLLAKLKVFRRDYSDLIVAAVDGSVRCNTTPLAHAVNVADRPYFRRVLDTQDFAIGDFQISRVSGNSSLVVAQPVFDGVGEIQAVIAAGLDPASFNAYLADIALPAGSIVTLVDGKGTILARHPNLTGAVGHPVSELAQFKSAIAQRGQATIETVGLDGIRRLTSTAPVYSIAGDVYVRVGIPTASAYAAINRIYYRNLILLSAAALLVLALGWLAGNRLILRRVRDLASTSKRLGAGDLSARTSLAPDQSELGGLARTLDDMADGIQQHQARIMQVKEELRRSNRALRAIHDCEQVIAAASDENTMLQGVCDIVAAAGYRMAWAGLLRGDGSGSILPAGITGMHQDYLECLKIPLQSGIRGMATIGEALRTHRPAVARYFMNEARLSLWREEALRRGFNSKIALPLFHDQETVGILNVYAMEQDAFGPEEVELLTGLAQGVTIAILSCRHRAGRQAAEAALHLRNQAIETSNNGMLIVQCGEPSRIVSINAALLKYLGLPAHALPDHGLPALGKRGFEADGWKQLMELLKTRREGSLDLALTKPAAEPRWFDVSVAMIANETVQPEHAVIELRDVTDSRRYQKQIEYQATHDALTGLPNRTLLYDRMQQLALHAQRHGTSMAVAFVDLDRFKYINDSLGHDIGDLLLKTVAERLKSCLRKNDTVARQGGDEFVLVLSDAGAITQTMQRILHAVSQPWHANGMELQVNCSMGVSICPADGFDVDVLLRNADAAMYKAKQLGRNNVQYFSAEMNSVATDRLEKFNSLRRALSNDEFVLHYQPKINSSSGATIGMEALIRWPGAGEKMMMPADFIPLAEESGLILPIGEWVLRTACTQNRAWQRDGLPAMPISVNVSSLQLGRGNIVEVITEALNWSGLEARYLELEITESVLMQDVEKSRAVLNRLKALGVRFSIDDFGTGYSSLSHLRRLQPDTIKIDKSFLRDLAMHPDNAAIVRAIISLGHTLKLNVLAEGVETHEQYQFLLEKGCDEMQGYYFGRPMPAAQARAWLWHQHDPGTAAAGVLSACENS